jgi:hypothetical protein
MDGVILDALVRGLSDEDHLRRAAAQILGRPANATGKQVRPQ